MYTRSNFLRTDIVEGLLDKFNMSNMVITNEMLDNNILGLGFKLDKYMELIKRNSTYITMSDEEFEKYKYRPKVLCLDLYKNQEFWYIILKLNNMFDISQFTKKEIYVLNIDAIKLLNEIYEKENRATMGYI